MAEKIGTPQNGHFPLPLKEAEGIFSSLHCENLLGFLEVKLWATSKSCFPDFLALYLFHTEPPAIY